MIKSDWGFPLHNEQLYPSERLRQEKGISFRVTVNITRFFTTGLKEQVDCHTFECDEHIPIDKEFGDAYSIRVFVDLFQKMVIKVCNKKL